MKTFTGRTVVALTTLTVALPLTVAAPAAAAPEEVVYDALGDSFAAGFSTSVEMGPCGQTELAHPLLLDGRKRIALDDFAACSGDTTADLLAYQLPALDAETDLVTISIGGNDIGFAQTIGACLFGSDEQCAGAIAVSGGLIQTLLPGALDQTFAAVADAAPDAHVVVTGYPNLFTPDFGALGNVSVAEQEAINAGGVELNATIEAAAERAGFQYVDLTSRFDRHGANAPNPWISAADFHPTAVGQRKYAAALTAGIRSADLR